MRYPILAVAVLTACSETTSIEQPRFSPTSSEPDIEFLVPGYSARVVADGLTALQGVDQQGQGTYYGVLSPQAEVIRILPNGRTTLFAKIPVAPNLVVPALVDLMLDSERGMLVTDLRQGRIFKVSSSGKVNEYASGLSFPNFLTKDAQNRVYVGELGAPYRVTRVADDGAKTPVAQLGFWERPRGVLFDDAGNLLVLSGPSGLIRQFNIADAASLPVAVTDGVVLGQVPGRSLSDQALDFVRTASGEFYVVTDTDLYHVTGTGATRVATGLSGFNMINIDARGKLILTNNGSAVAGAASLMVVQLP